MSVHPLISPAADPARQAMVHGAAAHRLAVLHDDRHSRAERERLFFEAMMRIVDREMPGYAE